MSDTLTAEVTAPVAAPKVAKPKAKAKPAPKKEKPVKEKKERSVWTEMRIKVAKTLLKAGAVSEMTAINRESIAKKAGITLYQAGHHTYQTESLYENGFIKFADREEQGRCIYLTKSGQNSLSKAV